MPLPTASPFPAPGLRALPEGRLALTVHTDTETLAALLSGALHAAADCLTGRDGGAVTYPGADGVAELVRFVASAVPTARQLSEGLAGAAAEDAPAPIAGRARS